MASAFNAVIPFRFYIFQLWYYIASVPVKFYLVQTKTDGVLTAVVFFDRAAAASLDLMIGDL